MAQAKQATTQTQHLIDDAKSLLDTITFLDGLNIKVIQFYSTDVQPEVWVHPSAELSVFTHGKTLQKVSFGGSQKQMANALLHKGVMILWMQLETMPTLKTVH